MVYFAPALSGTRSHPKPVFSVGTHWRAPSVTVLPGGEILVTATTPAGKLYANEYASSATGWTGGLVADDIAGPSSVTTCYDDPNGSLGVITATSGDAVYFWWEFLNHPGWHQETIASPGFGVSFTGASITATSKSLLVVASTSTGTLYAFSQPIGGSGWTQQLVSSGVGPSSHPVITSFERLSAGLRTYAVIAATSRRGALDFWWQPAGASAWYPETIAKVSKKAGYASPAISVTGTAVIVTATNLKLGSVLAWYQRFNTNPWHEQLVAKG